MKTDRVLYELFLLLIYSCSMIKPGQTNQAGSMPIFEGSETTNLTAHIGSTAILSCKIRNNENKNPVSWIRLRDWHILTTDQSTFTNDERFHVIHQPQTSDWTLAIKFITKRDEGVYVCQVEYS
ncbi:uncharacterized protein LOC111705953 [Eurytemora carolleeae]|uniref:uncharacterized protein LOC111705953 n=1 Tax=Eurytemora carolleeae TaxID=1294199 RepID=UPI000C75D8E3|nr:uncharacterized protein LOC111705953 [Eurytemora carolleeae]|eukprot:XP_023334434.1 uncharacterized protein LOC111705953 [Eurytemora affinis]